MIKMTMSKEAMIRSLQGTMEIDLDMTREFVQHFPIVTADILRHGWDYFTTNAIRLIYNWAVRNEYICGCEQRVTGI